MSDDGSEDVNQREIASNGSDDELENDHDNIGGKIRNATEERLEEVSEQGSELFETDSSCGGQEEVTINPDGALADLGLDLPGQGKDIVAGSPTKINRKVNEFTLQTE